MLFTDPIPTPAARCGRAAVVAGLGGWVALAVSVGLYAVSLATAADDNLATTFRVACGWALGPAIVAFLAGVVCVAAGMTQQTPGATDPGLRVIAAGFALCAAPMLVVAAGAGFDKFVRPLVEPEAPARKLPEDSGFRPPGS